MAEIRVENLHKSFGDFVAVKGSTFTVARRRVLLPARPVGLRQDDDAADDRRPRAADLRSHPARRRGRFLPARGAARHRLRVPALRALSAYERATEHRLPAEEPGHGPRRDPRVASRRQRRPCASRICSIARCPVCPPAIASASRSDAPSCASPRPSSWTSRSARSTRNSGRS